jgi:glycosyltransferase involved in cell wall biosynthesis
MRVPQTWQEHHENGRGSTVVCIPVTAEPELLYRCLQNVVAHTAADTPVLVVDARSADPALDRFLAELDHKIHHLGVPEAAGPVELANAAMDACGAADVVLLASHALVFDGWLERLCIAAQDGQATATASALGNYAGPLSLWGPHDPLPANADLESIAAAVSARSPRVVPRTLTAEGHCIWIARAALELAGPFDTAFAALRPALVDFAQRCSARGLANVVADDVVVASVLPDLSAAGDTLGAVADRALLEARYRYLGRALADGDVWRPLERSLSAARRAVRPLSVTIDGRILRGEFSGAQAATLELIETLGRADAVSVRVLLDPAAGAEVLAALERAGVEGIRSSESGAIGERSDVVHRPYQVSSAEDLELLSRLGERLVITHLDLIAFHNPTYFGSFEGWTYHRRITRQALARADTVIFLSDHAARDAVGEGLVEPDRVRVVPLTAGREDVDVGRRRPARAPDGPFLLCIGNDYMHKNRLFAIRLLAALRARGWRGKLVLAGADVGYGSSRGEEAAFLTSQPELRAEVIDLPAVAEGEKNWLYANASAVVYPSVYEGFGLIPFEAARAGTPCLFASQASLAEVLPAEAATLVPWDAEASAERALGLLTDTDERRRHLDQLEAAAARLESWDAIALRLVEIYEQTARLEYREAAYLAAEAQMREAEIGTWIDIKEKMGSVLSPASPVPPDAQRGLIAVASRRSLSRPFFWVLARLYRFGRRS